MPKWIDWQRLCCFVKLSGAAIGLRGRRLISPLQIVVEVRQVFRAAILVCGAREAVCAGIPLTTHKCRRAGRCEWLKRFWIQFPRGKELNSTVAAVYAGATSKSNLHASRVGSCVAAERLGFGQSEAQILGEADGSYRAHVGRCIYSSFELIAAQFLSLSGILHSCRTLAAS